MTTWLKNLRLYLLRRKLESATKRMRKVAESAVNDYEWGIEYASYCDRKADLIDRIAELEKSQ